MKQGWILALAIAMAVVIPKIALAEEHDVEFTDEFPIESCVFRTVGKNPYVILKPGRQAYLNNAQCVAEAECDEFEEVWITVLPETHHITMEVDGNDRTIKTRVVEEIEIVDGELTEISRNFMAECKGTGDVYYFGEEVDIYEDGEIVSHDGAWEAGVDDAMPGIIMPGGAFLLGARYFQEVAPEVAMDRGEHVDMGLEIEVPAGNFESCVEVEDTNALEPDAEGDAKVYCPGTGIVMDEDLVLVTVSE